MIRLQHIQPLGSGFSQTGSTVAGRPNPGEGIGGFARAAAGATFGEVDPDLLIVRRIRTVRITTG